jgi:hypothetical protein
MARLQVHKSENHDINQNENVTVFQFRELFGRWWPLPLTGCEWDTLRSHAGCGFTDMFLSNNRRWKAG